MAPVEIAIGWLSQNAQALGVFIALPAGVFALWRFLSQRDLELRSAYRLKVLEQAFAIGQAVGEFVNAGSEEEYDEAWYKLAVFYSGPGQLIGDENLYRAFDRLGAKIWDLEYDEFDGDAGSEVELLAFDFMRHVQRVLNRHWRAKLSYVAPALRPHKRRSIASH